MRRWRVRVEGTPVALKELPRLLPPTCSIVEWDGMSCLESPLFNTIHEAAEVMTAAAQFVEAANLVATLRVPGWHPVACDAVAELREDGMKHWAKFLSASIAVSASVTASATVVRADGATEGPSDPPVFNAEAQLVMQSMPVRQALSFLQEGSWVSLYKAYEIVRADMGGDQALCDLGWATGPMLSRFRHTCQSPAVLGPEARHGVEPAAPPARPLGYAEARNLVASLIAKWIEG